MVRLITIFLLFSACIAFGDDGAAFDKWSADFLMPNDSLSRPEEGTVEICRDVTDLWHGTAGIDAQEAFPPLVQYHAFTLLTGQFAQRLFAKAAEVKRLRLVIKFRQNPDAPFEFVLKARVNRESFESEKFRVLIETQRKDPKRFLSLCQERLDGFWISETLKEQVAK